MKKIVLYIAILGISCAPTFNSLQSTVEYHNFLDKKAKSDEAIVAVQKIIKNEIDTKNWDVAVSKLNQLKRRHIVLEPQINQLLTLIESNDTTTVNNLSTKINTENFEYSPVISTDGKNLYFTRIDESNENFDENIFITKFSENDWGEPVKCDSQFNCSLHESPNSFVDENKMVVFANLPNSFGRGDNYLYTVFDNGVLKTHFPEPVNSKYFDADGQLAGDESIFIFTSDRRGNVGRYKPHNKSLLRGDYDGNNDIYVALRSNGKWQKPINLGKNINTPFSERTPFLSKDLKTLYFSSNGHIGLGGLDIFKSERLDDTWLNWSTPVNLGKNINTSGADWGYQLDSTEKNAYYSGNGDILFHKISTKQETLPQEMTPQKQEPLFVTVSGYVLNGLSNDTLKTISVKWVEKDDETKFGIERVNATTGEFTFQLLPEKSITIFAEKNRFLSKKYAIKLEKSNLSQNIFAFPITDQIEDQIATNVIVPAFEKAIHQPDVTEIQLDFKDFLSDSVMQFMTGYYRLNVPENIEILQHIMNVHTEFSETISIDQSSKLSSNIMQDVFTALYNNADEYFQTLLVDSSFTCLFVDIEGFSDRREINATYFDEPVFYENPDTFFKNKTIRINTFDTINNQKLSELRAFFTMEYLHLLFNKSEAYQTLHSQNRILYRLEGSGALLENSDNSQQNANYSIARRVKITLRKQ